MATDDEGTSSVVDPELFEGSTLRKNVSQTLFTTTEDRARLILRDHGGGVRYGVYWVAPISIALATLPVLLAAEFRDYLGVSAPTWEAIFVMLFFMSLIATVILAWHAFRTRNDRSIDKTVKRLMTDPKDGE